MIIEPRMAAFIDSMDPGNPPYLDELEKEAIAGDIPIIRKPLQSFFRFLLRYVKPKSILEVGTAIGFSAILMSEYAPKDCKITTIEKYEKRIPVAKENFRAAFEGEDELDATETTVIDIRSAIAEPADSTVNLSH